MNRQKKINRLSRDKGRVSTSMSGKIVVCGISFESVNAAYNHFYKK